MANFIAKPIPQSVVADARGRLAGGDPRVTRRVADAKPGFPCRRCLRDAEIDEAMLLFTYTPFATEGPYAESGPILAHEADCTAPDLAINAVPDVTTARAQCVVRAYDERGWIVDGRLTDTAEAAAVIRELFDDATVAYAHLRNVGYGCFAYRVDRA
jgi:hypothetical protein